MTGRGTFGEMRGQTPHSLRVTAVLKMALRMRCQSPYFFECRWLATGAGTRGRQVVENMGLVHTDAGLHYSIAIETFESKRRVYERCYGSQIGNG